MNKQKDIFRTAARAARSQFDSCYKMLTTLVEVCPDDVWYESFNGVPFWYQVYHNQYNYTYLDIIMTQTRHIMYNIGYLNGILRSKGLEESDWWAYNEAEE